VLWVGDGKALDAAVGQCRLEIVQRSVCLQGRSVWDEQDQAADGIQDATIPCQPPVGEPKNQVLVSREKQLEWSAMLKLVGKVSR